MSVWAILVAAGRGERLGLDRPKAFAKLGDEPLLAEPLRRLDASPWVDGIVLVAPPGWEEPAILLAEEEGCDKVHAWWKLPAVGSRSSRATRACSRSRPQPISKRWRDGVDVRRLRRGGDARGRGDHPSAVGGRRRDVVRVRGRGPPRRRDAVLCC